MDRSQGSKTQQQYPTGSDAIIPLEEALIKITRREEEARAKKEAALSEAGAMVEKARVAVRDAQANAKAQEEEIFKEEVKKFETEARLKSSEYLESRRRKNDEEVIATARSKIPAVAERLLEEEFLALKWFK